MPETVPQPLVALLERRADSFVRDDAILYNRMLRVAKAAFELRHQIRNVRGEQIDPEVRAALDRLEKLL